MVLSLVLLSPEGPSPMNWPLASLPISALGWSLLLLACCDGDQLLGSLRNVVGALDDLLGEELVVHRRSPGLRGRRLATLHLQPRGAGSQQAQGAVNRIERWPLQGDAN